MASKIFVNLPVKNLEQSSTASRTPTGTSGKCSAWTPLTNPE